MLYGTKITIYMGVINIVFNFILVEVIYEKETKYIFFFNISI